jgi:hypothetical protein
LQEVTFKTKQIITDFLRKGIHCALLVNIAIIYPDAQLQSFFAGAAAHESAVCL